MFKKRLNAVTVIICLLCVCLFCGCSSFSVEKMRLNDYGITLPKGTKLLYACDATDSGGGGEGNAFYINEMNDPESFIAGIKTSLISKDEFIFAFENFLNYFKPQIGAEHLPDLSGDFLWAHKTGSVNDRNSAFVIYSPENGLVYVGIELR